MSLEPEKFRSVASSHIYLADYLSQFRKSRILSGFFNLKPPSMLKKLFLFFIFSQLLSFPASAEKELLGLQKKDWEGFFDEPLYLEVKEKNQMYPLYLGEFLEEKYFFQKSPVATPPTEIINPYLCFPKEKLSLVNFCAITQSFASLSNKTKIQRFFIQEEELKNYLDVLAGKINSAPTEGKYRLNENNNFVAIEESLPGFSFDVEKNQALLLEKLESGKISTGENIPLVVTQIAPSVTPSSLKDLGIAEKIAHGESNFVGSPANRIHNIHVAVTKFDGVILKPGEELSFVSLLGDVDESTGYKEELVIKDNKTIPEFGGGICQVSTTLFRAALNGGMKITERQNHAYPVGYYSPQGTDATIYIPKPDLRFLNDTPGHLLIQASFDGNKLMFDFFGTSDQRQVSLEGPTVTEKTPDGKMKVELFQIVKNQQGEEIRKDIFKSFYDNPDKYHEPNFSSKPSDWSTKQWEEYLKKRN